MSELISKEEALIALDNGKDVEYLEDDNKWHIIDKETVVISALLNCKLRLKPRTITINGIEVPAPFKPKEGEYAYVISDQAENGWIKTKHESDFTYVIGAWRSEEEIKQVITALRKVFNDS